MRVSLFVTCLTDTFYPRVGRAMVAVLEHFGCRVDFPREQTCCGQPMFNSGCHDEARDLARGLVSAFDGAECVVTPSGSCCAMVHDYYRQLLPDDPRCERFVARTHEFVDFLLNVLQVDLAASGCRWPGEVTYHYSCHLRGLEMTHEAVRLMEQIEGLQVHPMRKAEQCCGFGGTFAVKFSEVSASLLRDKIACAEETGASTLVSNDGGCSLHIQGGLRRHASGLRIKHVAEIIAEGLGLLPTEAENRPEVPA
jgi:L-lactate dehydrogenase complex protein LldE